MKKLSLYDGYCSSAVYIINFERNIEIRHKFGEVEKLFSKFMNNQQAQMNNIPDESNPPAPRIIFKTDKKSIFISQVNAQLRLIFKKDMPLLDQINIIEKNIITFDMNILSLIGADKIEETGYILTLNYPVDSSKEISESLYSKHIKMPPVGEVVNVNFTIGYSIPENLFLNISCASYEVRYLKVPIQQDKKIVAIKFKEIPIDEQGLEIKLDVNDKPNFSGNVSSKTRDYNNILKVMNSTITEKLTTMMGFMP